MANNVLISNKNGYKIWGEVSPRDKRLCNFNVEGVGARRHVTYALLAEAENLINYLIKEQEKKKNEKFKKNQYTK